jgi:hypothetical protein
MSDLSLQTNCWITTQLTDNERPSSNMMGVIAADQKKLKKITVPGQGDLMLAFKVNAFIKKMPA